MDLTGTVVDRYQVEAQLGQGSYGAVYRARHVVLDKHVALKVLWPDKADDPKNVERFLREARAAASIGNERIARVVDAGTTPDGVVFLALELLDGSDLSEVLEVRGRLSVEETVRLMVQVLDGLGAAHGQGIVHRDLKPANVFVTRTGGIKILDFGISKILGAESLTERGVALGTPRYMAPEQLSGSRVDARADLYAVGVMIYQMLCGASPYDGTGYELIVRRVKGEAPVPLGTRIPVPSVVEEVVHRALSSDPADRWPSAGSLRRALEAAERGERLHEPAHAVTLVPSISPLSGPVPAQKNQAAGTTVQLRPPDALGPTARMPSAAPPPDSPSKRLPGQPGSASSRPEARPTSQPSQQGANPAASRASGIKSIPTAAASKSRRHGPAWGWAAIAGLAVLFSLALGVFGVLAWRVSRRETSARVAVPPAAPAPAFAPTIPPPAAPTPIIPAPVLPPPVVAAPSAAPAPDPSLVQFEVRSGRSVRSALEAHLEARRARFADCAVERPAEVPLRVMLAHQALASEHNGYSSTAPAATRCVIEAFMSGPAPRGEGSGEVFVRLPARGG